MLKGIKLRLAALTGAVAIGIAAFAAGPASAQQEGLVNLAVTDVNVQVPVGVAANLCDVNAAVLADLRRAGGAECTATTTSVATSGPGDGNGNAGPGPQQGLVNVIVDDVNVQVPIGVAANICDVNVGVLAQLLRVGGAQCDADADVDATRSPGA